jgi:hydroxybutyrate-dimer hydrolase
MDKIPAEIVGRPVRRAYDGVSDDLLTAGLGLAGLRAAAPEFADVRLPSAAELRRRAIHASYVALVDVSDAGGFGRLYGPEADRRLAGVEYLLAVRTPDGTGVTSVWLQIPAHFDPSDPCLLAVAASGSRGVHSALPTAAEWGLKRGCAVVHSDKGTGIGVWDVDRERGYRIDGILTGDRADPWLSYAPGPGEELEALKAQAPHTLLFKHAQSRQNGEAHWGEYLLQAIAVAFELLNEEFRGRIPGRLDPDNTLVLAAGISNGGATVLRALEADRGRWIDGAAVSEPNAVVAGRTGDLRLASEAGATGIRLYDYANLHFLMQPAAILAENDPAAPFFAVTAAARPALESWCRELQAVGLLPAGDVVQAARAARARLIAEGILPQALALGHFNRAASLWPAVSVGYASAYAKLAPWEMPFGIRYAATGPDGRPRALTEEEATRLWCDASGIAPTAGVSLLAPAAEGERATNDGSVALALALAPDRLLAEAAGPLSLPAGHAELMARVEAGHAAVVMNAAPGNRPLVIIHGRGDGLIPVNHASRAYYAVNRRDRGERDELRYYEVEHGQHFDGMLGIPGFAERYVPMQPWLVSALELVYTRLKNGAALPPSQVIRSRPRRVGEALSAEHLGRLAARPDEDAIRFADRTLTVPP